MPQISQILTLHFTCQIGYCAFSTLLPTCNSDSRAAERGATWKGIKLPCNKGDITVRHGRQGVFSIVRCPRDSGLHFYPSFHATVLKDNTHKRDTKQTWSKTQKTKVDSALHNQLLTPAVWGNVSPHTPQQWSHTLTWCRLIKTSPGAQPYLLQPFLRLPPLSWVKHTLELLLYKYKP